jgi:hypothetical protein
VDGIRHLGYTRSKTARGRKSRKKKLTFFHAATCSSDQMPGT